MICILYIYRKCEWMVPFPVKMYLFNNKDTLLHTVGMPKIWKITNTKCGQGTLIHRWWRCKRIVTLEDSLAVFYKTNRVLPTILIIGIYQTDLNTHIHTKTCIWMFIAALFVIAKNWKQPRCPSIGEWINKPCYKPTIAYLAIRRNGLSSHKKMWINFKSK